MVFGDVDGNLDGSLVVILGASGGIGFEVAAHLSSLGAQLILFAKTQSKDFLDRISNLDRDHGSIVVIHDLDLTNQESLQNAVKIINAMENIPDAIVVASGTASGSLFEMTRSVDLRRVFEVNFFGPLQFIQGIIRKMKKNNRGSIVFVSSVAGIDAKRGNICYGTSKAALNFAIKILSIEVAASNLRVNAVAPGLVKTKMLTEMNPTAMQEMLDATSLGRPAEPSEVAQLIAFLISDRSSHITGQIVRIDGGRR
jgi:3-oxoacyl-[acyl-carrier protein] reductase